jgi:hypothetical protein
MTASEQTVIHGLMDRFFGRLLPDWPVLPSLTLAAGEREESGDAIS